ncbi:MAG: Smr/MutS family protein [Thermoanaerobaculum sp.]|nr:Smr/MutS family protein [Thermoanaerobaculum sp.]MDW7968167.1 Smr/MutS family protein [Thermoanaerobaculum sp.]
MVDEPRPHAVPIEDSFDLHAFHPKDLEAAVEAYLEAARERGFRQVRLIHGKGKGVARARVAALLARLPYVLRAYEAPPQGGGWGATVVELIPEREEGTPPR